MLYKWKQILNNWINCYCKENHKKEQNVNIESLINIISHLRQNLNLDDSKSSRLEAHTVEEFIIEKYPEFKFENGTLEFTTEEHTYIGASLLLFFVCVNSKDVDIKNAMCSKLDAVDQEIIMKYTKYLMSCTSLSYRDVQAAVTEACGQDEAAIETPVQTNRVMVAETPPVLRSLHSEVRRLQASLDAERFDRNYLQDELTRLNTRLERILKEKEQYKLEILNLKAKLSLCGQENDVKVEHGNDGASVKLTRQLQELEELLVDTQGQLDEALYEKDMYKTKMDQLKEERKKLLTISEQETFRAGRLEAELEAERRNSSSLRELVAELRQHNQLNQLDTSQLECDDLDTSVHSIQNNMSVCSEACANVIEVQLGEERANIVVLKQQIQTLQDQLNDLHQHSQNEKQNLEVIISEKDTDINNLKHRVNEEIQEKNNLKAHFNDEVSKLNNEINELEQNLKDKIEYFRLGLDQKAQEIIILREEKLSLLQSFSDETTKLENMIKELKTEVNTEKVSKSKMREDYENHIMKLNEKVSNRNNELVELQNNILEKSELIENLYLDLKKEKESKEELSNKCNNEIVKLNEQRMVIESRLQQQIEKSNELERQLEQKVAFIDELGKEINNLVVSSTKLENNCKILENTEVELNTQIQRRNSDIENMKKQIDDLITTNGQEKEKLRHTLEGKNTVIDALQIQLQNETEFKAALQVEIKQVRTKEATILEEVTKLNTELTKLRTELREKEQQTDSLQLMLNEEKCTSEELKKECDSIQSKLHKENNLFKEELCSKDRVIESLNNRIVDAVANNNGLHIELDSLKEENDKLNKIVSKKYKEISQLRSNQEEVLQILNNKDIIIKTIEQKLDEGTVKQKQLEKDFITEIPKLMTQIDYSKMFMENFILQVKSAIDNKEPIIQKLNMQIKKLQEAFNGITKTIDITLKEKNVLLNTLNEEISFKTKLEKEYQNQCIRIEEVTTKFNAEIISRNDEIKALKKEIDVLVKSLKQKSDELNVTENKLANEKQVASEQIYQKEEDIKKLNKNLEELESLNDELKKEKQNKTQMLETLQKENEQLQFIIEEDNSNYEIVLKEKDAVIERLERQLKFGTDHLESLQKEYKEETLVWENFKMEFRETLEAKNIEISQLTDQVNGLKKKLKQIQGDAENIKEELTKQITDIKMEKNEMELTLKNEIVSLTETLSQKNKNVESLSAEKEVFMAQLSDMQTNCKVLEKANQELMEEKNILHQKLGGTISCNEGIIAERNVLVHEKRNIEQRLMEELIAKKTILEEKECLTQQLLEANSGNKLAEKENDKLCDAKQQLEQTLSENIAINKLLEEEKYKLVEDNQRLTEEKSCLEKENIKINEELFEEKLVTNRLGQEKENLIAENETLKQNLVQQKNIQDVITKDNELLTAEKEYLLNSLSEEKVLRDQMEIENNMELVKLQETHEKQMYDLKDREEQIQRTIAEFKQYENDFKLQEEINFQISVILNTGLENVLKNLEQEEINNDVLHKLINVERMDSMSATDKCDLLISIVNTLTTELSLRKKLENALLHENTALTEMRELFKQKEMQAMDLQSEIRRLQQNISDNKRELTRQKETSNISLDAKVRDIQKLQAEKQSLQNELNDVKTQLEIKVHSLKEKLVDNENLTEKLKKAYECQIENLNMMTAKLSNYLKDKTMELEILRTEKEKLQQVIEDNNKAIKSLQDEVKSHKQNQEKLIGDFESERNVLKNMVTVTESVMEDQKTSLDKIISEHIKANQALNEENKILTDLIDNEKQGYEKKVQEKEFVIATAFKELSELKTEKEVILKEKELQFLKDIETLKQELNVKVTDTKVLEDKVEELTTMLQKYKDDITVLEKNNNELENKKNSMELELQNQIKELTTSLKEQLEKNKNLEFINHERVQEISEYEHKVKILNDQITELGKQRNALEQDRNNSISKLEEIKTLMVIRNGKDNTEINMLKKDNTNLVNIIEENKTVIANLEQVIKHDLEQNQQLRDNTGKEKLNLLNKCSLLEEYQIKAEKELAERQREINTLTEEVKTLKSKVYVCEQDLKQKDEILSKLNREKDEVISTISKELAEQKAVIGKCQEELEIKTVAVYELKQKLEDIKVNREAFIALRKENEDWIRAVGQRETFAIASQERASSHQHSSVVEKGLRVQLHQVDNTSPTEITYSSIDSLKTITDLEKIIHDKNRSITTLQSDITYLKSLLADSENKLLDVTKELDVSKENCHQLSNQLKKIVHQKNEEIAELKKQVSKLSATETRATQIIKVSAKYQAIILKRIAEIKSNTILKELTNFGNSACNGDSELRRGLNAGAITMEDLENFLETTDRHLRRCSEKQMALQNERDRLVEVNRINESEIINLKKFLMELSVSFKTFTSIRELYTQKLSKVVSIQRTARREILNLEGTITDATMCKLERGYAAVIQDLSECAMNLERWMERSIGRTISPEKIKQAFSSDVDRASMSSVGFQNTSLEVQLEELEKSFQKLLEEVARAQRGEGARGAQDITVMEVRAEYEDKLNRMKAKMKQLYQERVGAFRMQQKEEFALLERELQKARDKLTESSKAYEEHIRALTSELWNVGEKFLIKKDEADWLRKKQRSGSLMSLQHVHSSGLVPHQEEPSRPSDTYSLRSLPMNANNKSEGRGLHMSDEEGEVFDNRWLKELTATPRRSPPPGRRLSELRWRNSLCPPHLKSSYPAETQFAPTFDEDEIKCTGTMSLGGPKQQRKEVGITAYKKPGPPTPSKQAGRLSATDSELRESLRMDPDAHAPRKTSTPSRLRALFRSNKNDTAEGTPRSRRLSNIFRKK